MIKLNTYIYEAWSGVKQQSLKSNIGPWCDEMGIENYTVNSQGEIDVDGSVDLMKRDLKELPYKFGKVKGYFSLNGNPNLTSLKNCPDKVEGYFSCSSCKKIDSLKGCPKYVGGDFYCVSCKREFTKKEVKSLCKVKEYIYI